MRTLVFTAALLLAALGMAGISFYRPVTAEVEKNESPEEPYEFFMQQRMYPDAVFDDAAYKQVMQQISAGLQSGMRSAGFSSTWTLQGPGNIGGRINCVAVKPGNPNIMLAGNAAGGIFKTIDGGATWYSVFDAQSYLAISCIVYDPQHPDTLYAGTGDRNMVRYTFNGNGLYRSTDGGETWQAFALAPQGIVAQLVINPLNTQTMYAATMGNAFAADSLRGVYKTTDGGLNWQRVLLAGTNAGCIDLVMNPQDTAVLYAASWNSLRSNSANVNSGLESKLWKTSNAGSSWQPVNGTFNQEPNGRISLAISNQNPDKLYACVVDTFKSLKGIYLTTNGGTSWTPLDVSSIQNEIYGSGGYYFGWYFGLIRVNPTNDNEVYVGGIQLYRASITNPNNVIWDLADPEWWTYEVHADKHDLFFIDGNTFMLATDGGLYKTTDLGGTWSDVENIPNTQFYRVAYNPHNPSSYYGGAQDNGTTGGNALSFTLWDRIYGGDGFRAIFHPTDPLTYFCETQNGAMVFTNDGGMSFFDFTSGIDFSDRINWDFPYVMNATDPSRFYAGTHCVYQMTSAPNNNWVKMSGDLTDGNVTGNSAGQSFNVISGLNSSSKDGNLIYACTTDGNVWRSDNDCASWINISAGLPDRYVTSVKASPNHSDVVFVSHSGYRSNELIAHVHRSLNRGAAWQDISGNLPQVGVNDLLVLPGSDSVLFAATDAGVYATLDGGTNWERLGINMPLVPVFELCLNNARREVVAGTYGRSIYSYSLDSLGVALTQDSTVIISVKETDADARVTVFPNPASDALHLQTAETFDAATVYNLTGEVVLQYDLRKQQKQLDISTLPSGTYLLQLQGRKTASRKFVKL